MTHSELTRQRRQIQQRIREVLAQRRLAATTVTVLPHPREGDPAEE